MGKSPYFSHTPIHYEHRVNSGKYQFHGAIWGLYWINITADVISQKHAFMQVSFFLSKARWPRVISGILAGQQCHTNVNSPRHARPWWAAHCSWPSHFPKGPFSQSRGCALHNTGGHITLWECNGQWCFISWNSREAFAHSCHPHQIFLLLWGKMGPLSGKKTQALITQRGTGVGGAPHHHPHLLQTCARQSPPHWEQSHSGKAGTVTQTLQIQTQLHMPSLSLTLGHTAGLAVPRPHSSSCFL